MFVFSLKLIFAVTRRRFRNSHLNAVVLEAWKAFATAADDFFLWRRVLFFLLHLWDEFLQHPWWKIVACRWWMLWNMFEFSYDQLFCHYDLFGVNWLLLTLSNFFIRSHRCIRKKVEASKWRANWDINRSLEVWLLPRENKVRNCLELWKPRHVKSSGNNH